MKPVFKILCVEPLAEAQELLRTMLTEEGYQVVITRTMTEALGLFQAQAPALVIVDLDLPRATDGLLLYRSLRAQSVVPSWYSLPTMGILSKHSKTPESMLMQ